MVSKLQQKNKFQVLSAFFISENISLYIERLAKRVSEILSQSVSKSYLKQIQFILKNHIFAKYKLFQKNGYQLFLRGD